MRRNWAVTPQSRTLLEVKRGGEAEQLESNPASMGAQESRAADLTGNRVQRQAVQPRNDNGR